MPSFLLALNLGELADVFLGIEGVIEKIDHGSPGILCQQIFEFKSPHVFFRITENVFSIGREIGDGIAGFCPETEKDSASLIYEVVEKVRFACRVNQFHSKI